MEVGPIYGVELLDSLPLDGGMRQAMPSAEDLRVVRKVCERTAAGYEVLLEHYRRLQAIVDELTKCWRLNDAGELVQDMPVVPNKHYWIILRAGVVRILVTSIEFGGAGWWVSDSTGEGYDPSDLFSTREAAEKAGKE